MLMRRGIDQCVQVRARGGNSWAAPILVGEARCSEGREVGVSVSFSLMMLSLMLPLPLQSPSPSPLVARGSSGHLLHCAAHSSTGRAGVHNLRPMIAKVASQSSAVCDALRTQAPFSIRVYSSQAIELQRVPMPRCALLLSSHHRASLPRQQCQFDAHAAIVRLSRHGTVRAGGRETVLHSAIIRRWALLLLLLWRYDICLLHQCNSGDAVETGAVVYGGRRWCNCHGFDGVSGMLACEM
jgi:hypothetical protein